MQYPPIPLIYFLIGFLLIASGCQEDPEIIDPVPPPVQGFSEPFLSSISDENPVECDDKMKASPFIGKWEVTGGYRENFLIINPSVAKDTVTFGSGSIRFKIFCNNTFAFFADTITFNLPGTYDSITRTQVEYGLWDTDSDSLIKFSDRVRSLFKIDGSGSWNHCSEIAYPIESSDPAWMKSLGMDNAIIKQRGFDVHHICSTCDPFDDYFPVYTYTLKRIPE